MGEDATGYEPTRTVKTEESYRRIFRVMTNGASKALGEKATLGKTIDWYVANHGVWSAATIRSYNAGLKQRLLDLRLAGRLPEETHKELCDIISTGPTPQKKGASIARGPARKRKSIKDTEVDRLMQNLAASKKLDDRVLLFLIINSIRFFPRPGEWVGAWYNAETCTLMFPNSKRTNDRGGVDSEREFDLSKASDEDLELIQRFLQILASAVDRVDGDWDVMISRQKGRLKRWCEKLQIKRIAFYTFRHVGMATARAVYDRRELAYLSGHIATGTAGTHYPDERTGLKGPVADLVGTTTVSPDRLHGIRVTDKSNMTREEVLGPRGQGRSQSPSTSHRDRRWCADVDPRRSVPLSSWEITAAARTLG